jgi:Tol biopolymer transport system component
VHTRRAGVTHTEGHRTGSDLAWSPDGTKLAIVYRGYIWIGKKRVVAGTQPRWFSGGRWLAFSRRTCGASAGIWLRDFHTRRNVRLTRPC